jgi:hypothetical protein
MGKTNATLMSQDSDSVVILGTAQHVHLVRGLAPQYADRANSDRFGGDVPG